MMEAGGGSPGRGRELPQGTILNGYTIECCIGDGGFGVTYRVHDMLGQVFALKEYFPDQFARREGNDIVPTLDDDADLFEDFRSRFVDEALKLVRLGETMRGESSVVKVRTCFEANRSAYMVMEYIAGDSLDDVLRQHGGGLPEATLRALLQDVLHGLRLVHDAGILHRDIKPSNIIMRPDGRAVIIDFGSAREMRGGGLDYTRLYTLRFAPAEQIHGRAQGPYTDLYAVGAVGYRGIGGRELIDAGARHGALQSRQSDPMVSAATVGAGRYSPSLLAVLDKALAVEKEQRWQSAGAMLDALSAKTKEPKGGRRRWRVFGAATLVAVAGVALWFSLPRPVPPPPPDPWARMAALVSQADCMLLFRKPDQGSGISLSGVAPQEQANRLLQEAHDLLATERGTHVTLDLTPIAPGLCPAIAAIRQVMGAGLLEGGLSITLASGGAMLQQDDAIFAEVTLPNVPAYLIADYVQTSGNVSHLYPRPAVLDAPDPTARVPEPAQSLQPAQLVKVGARLDGNALFTVSEPYGTDLIVSIASAVPLFSSGQAVDDEPGGPYLVRLEQAIRAARANGPLSIGIFPVTTAQR